MRKKKYTLEEVTKMGGEAKKKKYGKEVFSEMGKRGVVGKKKKYGNDYYKNIRKIGIEKQKRGKKSTTIISDFLTHGAVK